MENIVKKLFLGGCILVAGAVSVTALASSYAISAEGDKAKEGISAQSTFKLTVQNVLTLSDVNANTIEVAKPSQLTTGTLSAKVTSSSSYNISLSAEKPELSSADESNTEIIPAASGSLTTEDTANPKGWGIKKDTATSYTALTTNPDVFLSNAPAAINGLVTDFEIGVKTSPTLPADTYSTTVTVTAAAAP